MRKTVLILLSLFIGSLLVAQNTVTDIEGNVYKTVKIGCQTWMATNLRTTTYSDGTAIPNVTTANKDWNNLTNGAYCTYNNTTNTDTINTFGRLYNWNAVKTNKLCPNGWHVPSDDEWTSLEIYLVANGYNYDGSTTGNKIAKAMASTTGWDKSSIIGALGNNTSTNNASGFTALPCSYRYGGRIGFGTIYDQSIWWSSTEYDTSRAFSRSLYSDLDSLTHFGNYKYFGNSVRCLSNIIICDTLTLYLKTNKASICLGDSATLTASVKGNYAPFKFVWSCGGKNDSVVTVHPTVITKYFVTVSDAQGFTRVDSVTITVNQPGTVSIDYTTLNTCINNVICKATTSNGGINPSYLWKINGENRGLSVDSYSSYTFRNNDIVVCEITNSDNGCKTKSKAIVIKDLPANNGLVTDIEGNTYKTVSIGSQLWMAENLKTTTYSDGTAIPNVTDKNTWDHLTTGALCTYNNTLDADTINTFGRLYNWYAVNTGKLCPSGWHEPSDDDWTTLCLYLVNTGYSYDGIINHDMIGKSLASTKEWRNWSPRIGDVGNSPATNNKSGFTAIPSGYRTKPSNFYRIGSFAYFWSNSDGGNQDIASEMYLNIDESWVNNFFLYKYNGLSVRCLRDITVCDTLTLLLKTNKVSLCLGDSAVLTASVKGNNPPFKFVWSCSGKTDSVITVHPSVSTKYKVTVSDSQGFSRVDSIFITVKQSTISSTTVSICQGEKYMFNGNTYSTAGTYTTHLINYVGCDSVASLTLNVINCTQNTVTDIEGNVYKTVKIGCQTWMAENLRTTTYRDGTAIPNVTTANKDWNNLTNGAYCTNNNTTNTDTINTFGRLYNWIAVNTNKLCPSGWQVPGEDEWTSLETYLIANGFNYDGSTTGNKIAKAMASTTGWGKSSVIGNLGNNTSTNNASGFTALPCSYRDGGRFSIFNDQSIWWSSNEYDTIRANSRSLYSNINYLMHYGNFKYFGFSVRCLSNIIICDTLTLQLKTNKASICLGDSATLTAKVKGNNAPFKFEWSCGGKNDSVITVHPTVTTKYLVTVSDAQGFSRVDSVTITVNQPGSITIDSTSINNCIGKNFICKATTSNCGTNPTFQWQINGEHRGTSVDSFASYTFRNSDMVICEMTNSNNGCTTKSNAIIFKNIPANNGIVIDIDGNTYKTVSIGSQIWIAENLRTTTYNDGTVIPNVTDNTDWSNLTTGAQCTFNNTINVDTINTYGRLYNWFAVNTNKLCPSGWHVPSDVDWTSLETYLIANGYNYDGSTTGNKIAKAIASTTGWNSSPSTGAIGNNLSTNNISGFTGLPTGYRNVNGKYADIGSGCDWWSSIKYRSNFALDWGSSPGYSDLKNYNYATFLGVSVRCISDIKVCDTLTLQLKTNKASICLGDSATLTAKVKGNNAPFKFEWSCGGKNDSVVTVHPNVTTNYKVTVSDAEGTTRIDSISIIVKQTTSSSTTVSICQGENYTFNGNTYTTVGTYYAYLTDSVGCDSVASLILNVKQPSSSIQTVTACENFTFHGTTYINSGTYIIHDINTVGCDSSITLHLTINKASLSTTNTIICKGDNYIFNGKTYSTDGTYIVHLTNSKGCDSIASLILKVKQPSSSIQTVSACNNFNYHGINYINSGTYLVHDTNAVGCDSSITLHLTINQASSSTTNATICKGNHYTFNGTNYSIAGNYETHLTNIAGCDSTAILHLGIIDIPIIKLPNDSIYCNIVNQIINVTDTSASYKWQDNNTSNTYIISKAGIYSVTATNACGIVTDNIKIGVVTSPTIKLPADILLCTGNPILLDISLPGSNKYLWQDFSTNPKYTISKGGTYSVSVTDSNNCNASKTITVRELAAPQFHFPNDSVVCDEILLPVDVTCTECEYVWNNGNTASKYTISVSGQYGVTVSNICGTVVKNAKITVNDCQSFLDVPTAFSPNGDGLNDVLYAEGRNIENLSFVIYDRWGQRVFESTSLSTGWDGTFKGKTLDAATFMYSISATGKGDGKKIEKKGTIALIR